MSDALDAPPRRRLSSARIRRAGGVVNLVMAFAIVVSLVVNIVDRNAQGAFIPSHYFQYFTVQTSILDAVVLLAGGVAAIRRPVDTAWYSAIRACTVAYAMVVGGVYNAMLASFPPVDGYVPNFSFPAALLHVWVPLFLVVEWVIVPGRVKLGWRVVALGLLYPSVWAVASAVRGTSGDGWFPYFFLNPDRVGALGVAAYLALMSLFVFGALTAAVSVGRFHRGRGTDARSMRS